MNSYDLSHRWWARMFFVIWTGITLVGILLALYVNYGYYKPSHVFDAGASSITCKAGIHNGQTFNLSQNGIQDNNHPIPQSPEEVGREIKVDYSAPPEYRNKSDAEIGNRALALYPQYKLGDSFSEIKEFHDRVEKLCNFSYDEGYYADGKFRPDTYSYQPGFKTLGGWDSVIIHTILWGIAVFAIWCIGIMIFRFIFVTD